MPSYKQILQQNARKIVDLSDPEMKSILSVLREARDDTARGLRQWLKKTPADERDDKYTIHKHRALLGELDDAIDTIRRKMAPATRRDLRSETGMAVDLATGQIRNLVDAGQKKFQDSVEPLRIDMAKIVLRTNKMLIHRHEASAKRYAGDVGDLIQKQIGIGIIRGESVDQMVRRLTGKLRKQYDKLSDAEKAASAADRLHEMSRYQAERLVRTELIHAANVAHVEQLKEVEESRQDEQDGKPNDDDRWQKKWDASADANLCDVCEDLDGEIVDVDDVFSSGDDGPPAHPNCRCTVVPWRADWEDNAS